MLAPGTAGRHVMQAAFMVEDLEAAALAWVQTTGIGPFLLVPHIELAEYDYRGVKSTGLDFSVAIAQSGGIQIELVQQHCDSPSAYRDTITKGQQGFHHLAIYTGDYDATYRSYIDQGFASAVDGLFGDMRFSYIDTSAAIGCMIELIEESPFQSEFFARVAAEAEAWDGVTAPLRPAFPS
jgi:Glyoxalase/Bleomycin resistance protein/Dioxygenase superfamily